MIKVQIKKQDVITNEAWFEVQGEAQAWLDIQEANQSFGPKEEYEVVISDISQEIEQEKTNQEALAYLASTDWMVIRELDSGEPCPAEVKALRAAARLKVFPR